MIVERNPHVIFRDFADDRGGVLFDTETTAYHSLNELGSRIWRMLERPASLSELVSRLVESLDAPPPSLREDVATYVTELASRDLVRLIPSRRD